VACQPAPHAQKIDAIATIRRGEPILWQGFRLTLVDYLENAF
jgi:hypothetical protein